MKIKLIKHVKNLPYNPGELISVSRGRDDKILWHTYKTAIELPKGSYELVLEGDIDPFNLKKNSVYILSKDTPLMPQFDPKKPLKVLRSIITLKKGETFKIIKTKMKRFFPWYNVSISNGRKGWINSIALVNQSLLLKK